jgi:hypothetical protein
LSFPTPRPHTPFLQSPTPPPPLPPSPPPPSPPHHYHITITITTTTTTTTTTTPQSDVFVEAQIQNIMASPMFLQSVALQANPLFEVQDLNILAEGHQ